MIRKGKCLKCGACCKNVVVKVLVPEEDQRRWMEYHGIELKDGVLSIIIDKQCQKLVQGSDGKYSCSVYDSRPDVCRKYPSPGQVKPCCGFKFVEEQKVGGEDAKK